MSYILILITVIIIPYLGLTICQRLWIIEHKKRADYYKRIPVPSIQWIPLRITLVICITILWRNYIESSYILLYIGAWTVLATVSTIDLFKPIPSWIRLIIQLILFGIIVIYGWVSIHTIRIGSDIPIESWIGIIWSIIWFVVCTNAVNRFDGVQGQSSGVTTIGAFSLRAVVTFIVLPSYNHHLTEEIMNQLEITKIIALSLVLVSLAYTYIEYRPLGLIRDIGTTIYGFSLAYLALLGGAKVGTLLVTLSLVMFDRVWVVVNRIIIMKKNPLRGDYTHFHHRLIANGRSRS